MGDILENSKRKTNNLKSKCVMVTIIDYVKPFEDLLEAESKITV